VCVDTVGTEEDNTSCFLGWSGGGAEETESATVFLRIASFANARGGEALLHARPEASVDPTRQSWTAM